jgi:hypothetical protein
MQKKNAEGIFWGGLASEIQYSLSKVIYIVCSLPGIISTGVPKIWFEEVFDALIDDYLEYEES